MGRRNIRPEAMEFQPDAVAVSEGEPPVQARIAVYVIFACLVFGGLWAWFSELDRVVSAKGMLVTSTPTRVITSRGAYQLRLGPRRLPLCCLFWPESGAVDSITGMVLGASMASVIGMPHHTQ